METHPGLFVSSTDTDEWEFDPEVGGDMHVLCTGVGTEAGMSRFTDRSPDEPIVYTPPQRETLVVLEGRADVAISGGATIELRPGVLASIPAGVETTWRILETPFKEFWVIA
jgi:mannose-6-phosphate isomerase-like protein (cupin superfamily)